MITVHESHFQDILLTVDNVTVEEISVLENSLGALLAELSVKDEETDQSYIYDVTDNTKSLYVSGNELRVSHVFNLFIHIYSF